jgi:hypothetical protein
LLVVAIEATKSAQEGFLCRVFGFHRIAQHPIGEVVDSAVVVQYQISESILIASKRAGDAFPVCYEHLVFFDL